MNEISFVSAFLIGVAGGVHCFGMCGGITIAMRAATPSSQSHILYAFSYHCGRIVSYTLAGAFTGLLGTLVRSTNSIVPQILNALSIAMLILMALYIGQWYRGLVMLEKLGGYVWKKIQPWSSRFIPFHSPLSAFPYGMIWGWLPCGLVYSTLSWSLATDGWFEGAAIMLFFGLGTFPTMLAASLAMGSIQNFYRHPATKQTIALLLLAYAGTLIYVRFV